MTRKGERDKGKKNSDKSPRRSSRSSRRRKKSDSDSSQERSKERKEQSQEAESSAQKKPVSVNAEAEVSSSRGSRRSTRRNQAPNEADTKSTLAPTSEEWVEDNQFWSAESQSKEAPSENTGECGWMVQASNGKQGEIQKLKISRTRLTGSESASELSPSPDKESLKKMKDSGGEGDGGRSESGDSESAEQPRLKLKLKPLKNPTSVAVENQDVVKTDEASQPSGNETVKAVEQSDSVERSDAAEPTERVEPDNKSSSSEKDLITESVANNEPVVNTIAESGEKDTTHEDPEASGDHPRLNLSDLPNEELAAAVSSIIGVDPMNISHAVEINVISEEAPQTLKDVEMIQESPDGGDDNVSMEINISPEEIAAATGGITESTPQSIADRKRRKPSPDKPDPSSGHEKPPGDLPKEEIPSRRSSQGQDDSMEINISAEEAAAATADAREEGELIESSSEDKAAKKIVARNNRSVSNTSNTSDNSTTSKNAGTTVKKHPLITGPEPDADTKVARPRKISLIASNPNRTVTPGRQVRSIAGDALKSILPAVTAEIEKKESEKQAARDKILKVRSEKQLQTPVTEIKPTLKTQNTVPKVPIKSAELVAKGEKMVVRVVDDVREVVNRIKEEKAVKKDKEEKKEKSKSDAENQEPKPAKVVRKVVVAPPEEVKAAKPPRSTSPEDSKATNVLFITNLVRPFTAQQLKELLARTGTIATDGFFIDKVKSKCFIKYTDVEMAIETRHALNGVKWPLSNPKTLKVQYVSESDILPIMNSIKNESAAVAPSSDSQWLSEKAIANDRKRVGGGGVREWDVGKTSAAVEEEENRTGGDGKSWLKQQRDGPLDARRSGWSGSGPLQPGRSEPEVKYDGRKRPQSPDKFPFYEPVRKFMRKDYDGLAKLLDDLFRKTKATPCLYWLPLSSAQIAVKEEMRRKHVAEQKRRMAEIEKSELARREKERERRRRK